MMPFHTLLFHTRFRELAFNSLKSFLELKTVGLKKIVLAHVIPIENVAFVPYGGMLKEDQKRFTEKARITFDDWTRTIDDPEITFCQRIEVGAPNALILDIAKEEKADLIAVGRKKRTPLEKIYVGTHVLDILRRSNIPVIMSKYVVNYEWQGESVTRTNDQIWKRPLLATDWSEPSGRALETSLSLNGLVEKVIITHVLGTRCTKHLEQTKIQHLEEKSNQRLAEYCRQVDAAGIENECHLTMGRTVEEILKISRDFSASMIIIGRTGKDWFQEYWLGGVSHRIAELSELPVLLIP